jgi:GNAT superfamily N-acetyltransferase
MELLVVDVARVRPLRHRVLRAHQPSEQVVWRGDEDPLALHLAAVEGGADEPVAVATIAPDPHPDQPRRGDWRVRGMATDPAFRGRGLGAALLDRLVEHAAGHDGARAWCFARTGARSLYARGGFRAEGDVFDLGDLGQHLLMSRSLRAPAPPRGEQSTLPSAGG